MAGMLWKGLMAKYSGWSINVIFSQFYCVSININRIFYLHVLASHEIIFLELIRHAKNLVCHLHNPRRKQNCQCCKNIFENIDLLHSFGCCPRIGVLQVGVVGQRFANSASWCKCHTWSQLRKPRVHSPCVFVYTQIVQA